MSVAPASSSRTERLISEFEIPEHLRPREYGVKSTQLLALGQLVRLSQTRDVINPMLRELEESIERTDMINQPDVACLNPEALDTYIDFVNRVWRSDHRIEDFSPDEHGMYYLVVAGHSRIMAVENNERRRSANAQKDGYSTDPLSAHIDCKIIDAIRPEQIIAYQLEENLHKMPSQERVAMALVETYLYGLEQGIWTNKTEFLEGQGARFSRKQLNDAIAFSELPVEMRDFTLAGGAKYGVVVEIAKMLEVYRDYQLFLYFRNASDADVIAAAEEIDEQCTAWVGVEIATANRSALNITAARKKYKSLRENWEAHMLRVAVEEADEANYGDRPLFSLSGHEEDWRREMRRTREHYLREIKLLAKEPFSRASLLINLHAKAARLNDLEKDEVLVTIHSGVTEFARKAGAKTLKSVEATLI